MEIYVVQPGDSIESIAAKFGITVERLISDNGLINPNALVQGQALVILHPQSTYIVQSGDTLESIAESNQISIMELVSLNPFLYKRDYIYPGEALVIHYNTTGRIATNGFAYSHIDRDVLKKTLPYLSYLSIFNYRMTKNAPITSYGKDTDMISLSKAYGTLPLLMITALSPSGELDLEYVYEVLLSDAEQAQLTIRLLQILKEKEFAGVNALMTNINESNQGIYIKALSKLSDAVRSQGYLFILTINPNIRIVDDTVNFEKLDYAGIRQIVDNLVFLQDVWGKNFNPPGPVISVPLIRPFIEYVITQVPSELISLWIPLVAYDWSLPFKSGKDFARSLSLDSAISLAYERNTVIQFDEPSQTPYFNYVTSVDNATKEHIVWFVDARTISALASLILEYKLAGSDVWNIMNYNQQLWSIIRASFDINKY